MNPFLDSLHDLFKWVPDWRSGIYISILALLILFRQTRLTLLFLFASAYLWGGVFMFAEQSDVPKFFHALYCAAGAVILIGLVVYFVRQRARS